ncbi:hypothetical protein Agub_g7212 [Astrephomene gubernaculifera]|uniref:Uncharacterized protein n=1 Tax=Astrephomene gubernaculifera TaxID=47775 RepID=A0AAD3HMK5_9CHLO|nr:hypothetical protein Agub_g7212 [Astrephomene gubernaculifera]
MRSCSRELITLQRWISNAATHSGRHHQCSSLVAPSLESLPSTSGRVDGAYFLQRLASRSYSAKAEVARTTEAAPAAGADKAAAVASPSSSSPAPFYAGLAQRYPDPDHIPEATLQRLRNELFGRPVRPRETTGRRALARPLQGRQLADWYFLPPAEVPGFHNEEKEYEVSKAMNRRQRKDAAAEEAPAKGKKKK